MRLTTLSSGLIALMSGHTPTIAEESLVVFQDLAEVTARISRLKDKPHAELIKDGVYQTETLIFNDVETGKEVWSLTRELCTDLANIERRCAWSCNGQYLSFIGNMKFWDLAKNELWMRTWAGHNHLALADGSHRRKLWALHEGTQILLNDKFNNWDQHRPKVLYYPKGDQLWRVTLGEGVTDNQAEPIHAFPNDSARIIQEISDDNLMLIEESGAKPNAYVIDLDREPGDPHFCLTIPLKGEVHPGSFRFRRSQPLVTGGYEAKGLGGIRLLIDVDQGTWTDIDDPAADSKVSAFHLWYGPPDDRLGFSGKVEGIGDGLFVKLPGQEAKRLAEVSDGHPTWCGHDPEWFFYAVGEPDTDSPFSRRLVAGAADGSRLEKICTPFDRRRGGKRGYDAIPRPNQSPDATKCWFHSSMLNDSDAHTGSYLAIFRRPAAPIDVTAKVEGNGLRLGWTPHRLSFETKGYHVYRSTDGRKSWHEATITAIADTAFTDPGFHPGSAVAYIVTAEEWSGLESDSSTPPVMIDGTGTISHADQGVRGWDTTPPPAPEGFSVSQETAGYRLTWKVSSAVDGRHYQVYASSAGRPEIHQRRRLVSPAMTDTTYLDWTAPTSGAIFYAITLVDRQGNESKPAFASIP